MEGVTLDDPDGSYLILNWSVFNATLFDPLVNQSVVTCIPNPDSGIAALQFLTDDPDGFIKYGNETLKGNLSGIAITSLDSQSENRNTTQGLVWIYNYSAYYPQYPEYGKITSLLWEGSTPEDSVLFGPLRWIIITMLMIRHAPYGSSWKTFHPPVRLP